MPLLAMYRRAWASAHRKSLQAWKATRQDHAEASQAAQAASRKRVCIPHFEVLAMLHARRLCRTRGEWEVVEPFGAAVAMFL